MTSTIIHSISPPILPLKMIHPGRCYICFSTTDAPIVVTYNIDFKERVKICSDACLVKYHNLDKDSRKNLEDKKENIKAFVILKPKPKKMQNAQAHLQALSMKVFNKDDLKLEDIEDLDLDKI